jgi:hypothetical protein
MYALDIGLARVSRADYGQSGWAGALKTHLRRSSSFLMTHSVPVLLHCVHSFSPFGTTHRIRLSRQDAQATDARWRTCCLLACFAMLARAETFSWLEMSVGGDSDMFGFFAVEAAMSWV